MNVHTLYSFFITKKLGRQGRIVKFNEFDYVIHDDIITASSKILGSLLENQSIVILTGIDKRPLSKEHIDTFIRILYHDRVLFENMDDNSILNLAYVCKCFDVQVDVLIDKLNEEFKKRIDKMIDERIEYHIRDIETIEKKPTEMKFYKLDFSDEPMYRITINIPDKSNLPEYKEDMDYYLRIGQCYVGVWYYNSYYEEAKAMAIRKLKELVKTNFSSRLHRITSKNSFPKTIEYETFQNIKSVYSENVSVLAELVDYDKLIKSRVNPNDIPDNEVRILLYRYLSCLD